MLVDGSFDELLIEDITSNSNWSFDDVEYNQDGFSFHPIIDIEYHPIVDIGYTVHGYLDGDEIARGSIVKINPITHDGEHNLRLTVNPPTSYHNKS